MATIRIPEEHWGEVWHALIRTGPITRIREDFVYVVSERHLRMLRRKKLPFEVVTIPNGRRPGKRHA